MAEGKKRFKAHINGKNYVIVGDSTPEHMKAVVDVVNQQLAEIKEMLPTISDEKAAILLAVNAVSDQIYKAAELKRIEQINEHSNRTE
ncbi:MAG: cell division protein ZapA [Liquorilactobacillus nagelii]|jgi:cell division protein ZapA|uniref:cell division protein ZapA n=1 Tax=Liquorilactobacillus nagelii TaxID=82688 RepID=UPI0006EFC4C1|nr:cell division protein ZapA [Liquorilactobacillus nagelii]KRL40513.1 hypothetical protein FD45_GL001931 [Liquorilactobacillus nagelii DSM 13675]MCI1633176.1 cell division protein ZapA [Liquorilactobacillus nagelii]MCI1699622.1 cell division protein ZapA [Liquorilactobacillus nagelii]MCI1921060.1 cell division protein ZapA [Liquorilactobacillus nagelii]MCI1975748.1 cell division protein ZapA [Liquorilactobacillus nagelii]